MSGALVAALAAALLTRALVPPALVLIARAGFARPNFRQEAVPVSAGTLFVLAGSFGVILGAVLDAWPQEQALLVVFAMLAMRLVGLADDVFGNREETGLSGHLGALMRGRLTTGGLKAVSGGAVAVGASALVSGSLPTLVLNAALIALAANAINLLDLRPGRAAKGFLLAGLLTAAFAARPEALWVLLPVAGALAAYLPYDLSARAMMGDAGSNALGVALGVGMVLGLGPAARAVAALLLVLLHLYAERRSLGEAIERVPVLRFLDSLGRE